MPVHEYKCKICGTVTSKLFRNSDIPDSLECGNCGFPASKILSKFNIGHSRGNGNYDTHEDIDEIVEMGYEIKDFFTGEVIEREVVTIPVQDRRENWN